MSKIIDLKKEKDKLEKKSIFIKLIFFVMIIYVIYAIYLIVRVPNDTIIVNNGTLTEEEVTTGYIIRDETVVQGKNYKNGLYQIVTEGEKVAKNQTIFRYYGKNENNLQQKIDEIDLKIQDAMEKEKNTIFPTDIKNLENQIDEKLQSLKKPLDIQTISEYKKEISDIILKKATIVGENSKSGSYIKKLIDKRQKYEDELTDGVEYVNAPISGIVSYRVDGFENILNVNGLKDLTAKDLEQLDLKTGKLVSTNNESAKVIDNFGCYIAVVLDSDVAREAEEGMNVKITLSSGNEINAIVNQKKEQEDGKMLIVFKTSALTEELLSYRKITFNITWWSYSGIKVPNSAIITGENDLKYVEKKTTKGTDKILVKVLKKNEKYSIIGKYSLEDLKVLGIDGSKYKGISVYDTIFLSPKVE